MKIQEMAQELPKFECLAEYIFKRRHLRDFHSPETSGVVGLIRFHDCLLQRARGRRPVPDTGDVPLARGEGQRHHGQR